MQGGSYVSLGVFRVNALALDPNHLGIMLIRPDPDPAAVRAAPRRARSQRGLALAGVIAFCVGVEILTLSRSGFLGLGVGLLVLAVPLRRKLFSPKLVVPVICGLLVVGVVASSVALRPHGDQDARHGVGPLGAGALPDLRARPARARRASAARPRAQHVLGLLPVPDRSHGLGAAQLLRRADRRDRPDRDRGLRAVPDLAARAPRGAASRGARAAPRRAIPTRHAPDRWPTACSRRCSARWPRTSST